MFENTIRAISDCHGIIERELDSEFLSHLAGSRQAALESWREHLRNNRARLTRVERTLADPLWVVLLGRFSSGKSTLVNAFLRLAKGAPTRLTDRHPTDTRATLIYHESANTGILETSEGQQEVEGLGISLERHALDDLRDLIIVDTPGFWDDQETDDALMRFLGQADVILHCMTPDSLLNLADKGVLDMRRAYFPSQVYQVVVTKAQTDTAYVGKDGSFETGEWDKDLAVLRNRFSAHTGENLDLSGRARSHGVWLIDSVTDYQVYELMDHMRSYAADSIENVPRVRAPIARDRLRYVCSQTMDQVVEPLLASLGDCTQAIGVAKDLLVEEKERYMKTVLGPNRESLRLRIREIKHIELSSTVDLELAAELGITPLHDTQPLRPVLELQAALNRFTNHLDDLIISWKESAKSFRGYELITNRHALNDEILKTAMNNLKIDVRQAYTRWFDQRDCGQQLQVLLRFQSLSDLFSHNRRPGVPRFQSLSELLTHNRWLAFGTAPARPADEANVVSDSEQLTPSEPQTQSPAAGTDLTTHATVADKPMATIAALREESEFTPESFESTLESVFENGMEVVLTNAKTHGESIILAELMDSVRKQFDAAQDGYARVDKSLNDAAARPIGARNDSVVARIRDSGVQKVNEVVASMRDSHEATLNRVHGELLGRGIDVTFIEDTSTAWESADKRISQAALGTVNEDFTIPAQNDLDNFVTFSKETVGALRTSLQTKDDDLPNLLQPDTALLRNTAEMYLSNSHGLIQTAVESLKVFSRFQHSTNFFDEKGIGGELERDLSIDLAHLCDRFGNGKRATWVQLIGSGAAILLLSALQFGLASGVVSFAPSWSVTMGAILVALIGVSAAGFLAALWKIVAFRENARATLVQKAKEQMDSICVHSKMNLEEERRNEQQAFAAAQQAVQGAITTFGKSGVSALANHLVDQVAKSLERLVTSCEQERLLIGKQLRGQLEAFRKSCHKHLDKVSERTSDVLRDGCSETMSEWITEAQARLDRETQNIAAIVKEMDSVEARMNESSNLAP